MRQLKILLLLIILTAAAAFLPVTAGAAQKPKLNLTKVTLPVKTGSYSNHMYLWLKGTKKKVKWTTSNKKIVSINKTYDKYCISIMTHKKGKATITAQVGKKKYKCKVTVKKAMSKAKLKKLISVDTSTIQQQYITFKNKSKDYYLSVHGKIHLYDSKGVQTDWDEPHVHLKPGQSVRVCIRNLHQHPKAKFTTENVYIDYEYHPIKATAKKQPVTGENNLPVLVTNKSYYKESLYYVTAFFKKGGKIVWAQQHDTDGATGKNINPGQSRTIEYWLGSVHAAYDTIDIQISRSSGSAFGGGGNVH